MEIPPDHPRGPAQARGERIRPAAPGGGAPPDPRPARIARIPVSLLRLEQQPPREPLRAHTLPLDPLLQRLPAALRAVPDRLGHWGRARPGAPSALDRRPPRFPQHCLAPGLTRSRLPVRTALPRAAMTGNRS